MRKFARSLTVVGLIWSSLSSQAATNWTGASDTDWNTAGNWDAGVPDGTDSAIIGPGVNVTSALNFDNGGAGDNQSQFTTLSVGDGSTLSYTGGGDFRGETWNIDGTVSMGAVSGIAAASTFNFGANGSLTVNGPFWANGHAVTLGGVIDLTSATPGTLVTHTMFSWTGNQNSAFGTITESFTEANGLGLTALARNTTPVNEGEYSFFVTTGTAGSLSVQYVTAVPEPSAAVLLGLAGFGLALRRRR